MAELVSLRTYATRVEAELARALLQRAGIAAEISADDLGGLLSALEAVRGVKLLVRAEDLAAADAALAQAEAASPSNQAVPYSEDEVPDPFDEPEQQQTP
jgi:hypothetical protein